MTKQELIGLIARNTGLPKANVDYVLEEFASLMRASLAKEGEITLQGVGKFTVANRAARTGRNPITGEEISIPARRVPAFKAAKALKDAVL